MSTYLTTSYTLAAMVVTFAVCSWRLRSPELSMVITAIVGALVAGLGFPAHLFVEGTERVMKALVDSLPMWIKQALTSETRHQGA